MISIALIGADGAGKTTIAEKLRTAFPRPLKYLYMGINMESSNVGLPTTRLIERAKKAKRKADAGEEAESSSRSMHQQTPILKKKGFVKNVWLYVRLLNRLAEEWYRQWLSWRYRRRDNVVLYDRHFLFDFDWMSLHSDSLPFAEKIHRWCLHRFYPEPDLVVFLDAPPEVLFARKGEASLEYLRARREAFLAQGKRTRNFKCIDATLPVDEVFARVCEQIEETLGSASKSDIPVSNLTSSLSDQDIEEK